MSLYTCYLCGKTAESTIIEDPDPISWLGPTIEIHPENWVRGYTYDDKADYCCQDHADWYREAMEIGPPAVRLLRKIFPK